MPCRVWRSQPSSCLGPLQSGRVSCRIKLVEIYWTFEKVIWTVSSTWTYWVHFSLNSSLSSFCTLWDCPVNIFTLLHCQFVCFSMLVLGHWFVLRAVRRRESHSLCIFLLTPFGTLSALAQGVCLGSGGLSYIIDKCHFYLSTYYFRLFCIYFLLIYYFS